MVSILHPSEMYPTAEPESLAEIWPRMIPYSWQGILSLGEMLVRVLGAWDERNVHKTVAETHRVVAGSSVCRFTVLGCCWSVAGPFSCGKTAVGRGVSSPQWYYQLYPPPCLCQPQENCSQYPVVSPVLPGTMLTAQ